MSASVDKNHPIVGTWRLISFTDRNLDTGAVSYPFGDSARAFVIYTADGYTATLFTRSDRKPPVGAQASEQEAAALYRSMIAFAGRYELAGQRLLYKPEISWNEAWNGTTQERRFVVGDNRLEVTSVPLVSPLTGARTMFSLVWERAAPQSRDAV